ncbi:MAG TPA: nicotinate (nicotinamide) nucleotide adenylyltransferase [Patescibacteria group bacterium]|nr:nicotinate (nicotinamide) nucleotide adenylyltransferase [Patescibacteria group bacterium]
MQVALFGGRFDPVHNGHLNIAREVLRTVKSIDEVWMVPDNQHHWNLTVASIQDRFSMLLLIEKPKIKVSNIGFVVSQRSGKTYTIDIIRHLQKKTTNTYCFIAGSDQIEKLHKWRKYEELSMRLPFLIFPRIGYQVAGELPKNCLWLSDKSYEPTGSSSTAIREKIKKGESIHGLVPDAVGDYIKKHKLYT